MVYQLLNGMLFTKYKSGKSKFYIAYSDYSWELDKKSLFKSVSVVLGRGYYIIKS